MLKAKAIEIGKTPHFEPAPIDQVVATIRQQKPEVVFAPHVETSAGIILPDDYIRQLGEATRAVGGLLVLDCIASGTIWVDMSDLQVDVLITAPQKGWSGSPCAGIVMLGERALEQLPHTKAQVLHTIWPNGYKSCKPMKTVSTRTTQPCQQML